MKSSFLVILALCAAFSAASEASSYWIPFAAPSSTTGGTTNLYVIPSDDLAAKPALVGKFTSALGGSLQVTVNSSNVITAYSPFAMLYLAVGTDGKTHVYGLNLTDVSAPPKAEQLSSFASASPTVLCNLLSTPMATNAFQPTTAFVLLHTNPKGSASCDKSGDVYEVVHYSDSPTKTPTVVDISIKPFDGISALPGNATPIYQSDGALGGVVIVDATGKFEFYAGDAFTSPTVLTTGVASVTPLYFGAPNSPSITADVGFFAVSAGTEQSLWRVSAAGKAEKVYTAAGTIDNVVADIKNIYFFDNVTVANAAHDEGTTTQHLYQESLSGGEPLHLYTAPPVISGPVMIGQLGLTLVGSNGSSLLMESVQLPEPTSFESSAVTLPVGEAGVPKGIAGPFVGVDSLQIMMCPQTFGEPTLQDVLLNVTSTSSAGEIAYSSEAVTMSGKIIQEKLPNSLFLNTVAGTDLATPQCRSNAGLIAQVRGITATNGSYGGGSIVAFNLHGDLVPPLPAVTRLRTSSGGDYTVATTDSVGGNAFFSSTGSIMAGYVGAGSLPLPPGPAGLAIDFSKSLIAVFNVPDSKIESLF